ncbi:hypothetical protein Neosp_008724 [[Neocosmospora] mangrovei]
MALSKVFSFLALNGLALSAIISTPAPSDALLTTTAQTGFVRETITFASGLVGVVDGTVLVLANTTLTPAPTAHTVGHHTISLGPDRVVVVDGETTTLPSPGDVGSSSFQPSTTVESSETDVSASTGFSDTPQETATTTTGSAQSESTDLPSPSDTTSGSGSLTTSDEPGSDSTTEPTSTATGTSSDSTSGSDSGSTSGPSPISDGQDITQSVSRTTSETTAVNPITGTVTEAPAGFSTELITNSDLTTKTWITTTKDDQETVVPVLVGCPGCGGAFGGIILWGLPSITNVVFNLPGLPSFYLPCIQVLGASIGQCTQGPSDPPEDNKPDPSSRPDDKTKTQEREKSASSSTCDATETATDVFVACSTGSAEGSATTTCSTSTRIVTGCSASGSTTTSHTGGHSVDHSTAYIYVLLNPHIHYFQHNPTPSCPSTSHHNDHNSNSRWETPIDKDGTYVEFFFTSGPPLGPQVFRVVAQSDGTTDKNGRPPSNLFTRARHAKSRL